MSLKTFSFETNFNKAKADFLENPQVSPVDLNGPEIYFGSSPIYNRYIGETMDASLIVVLISLCL